ncbi:hypothetical protein M440DRAFT_1438842 [Trichoderma longibrachiatum ATCC 18648]|uniref:C2H2-type domain-containing protein n=1 Tax=Trichoderma longibrachiatum ATCC 18648 TaxID=983965 RepID=A0A2T4C3D3_TRILO|nr:hypothetical protein M440DRAFT_1438842 [Trichoderma longibrachiatum ATCC 18648]
MDAPRLPSSRFMEFTRQLSHDSSVDTPPDFCDSMDANHRFPRAIDPADGHLPHDDLCLDAQASVYSAESLKPLKMPPYTFKASPPSTYAMASLMGYAVQPQSQARHGNSTPAESPSVPETHFSFSWDTYFNDTLAETSHPVRLGKDALPQTEKHCDDDCRSMLSCTSACGISCPSQCGDTGQGMCCDDDACDDQELCLDEMCEDAVTPCTDANCSGLAKLGQLPAEPGFSDGDKQAAAALASIGDTQLELMHSTFPQFTPDSTFGSHPCFPGGTCSHAFPHTSFQTTTDDGLAGQFWEHLSQEDPLTTHILQYHDPRHFVDHARPCIADDPNLTIPKCALPKTVNGDLLSHGLGHNPHDFACGFEVNTLDQFASHIFEDHWYMHMPHSDLGNPSQHSHLEDNFSLIPSRQNLPQPYFSNVPSTNDLQLTASDSSLQSPPVAPPLSPPPTSQTTSPPAQAEESLTESQAESQAESMPSELTPISPPDLETAVEHTCLWKSSDGKVCHMQFKDADDLHNHTKNDHLKDMTRQHPGFCCQWENCTRATVFGQKSKLERHIQTHTGYKPVKCSICGLQLSAKQSLDQHMRVHTGEKPWKCKFPGCSHAFKQQSALTMHERTHTGYKPLRCDICGKSFGESSNLSKHRRTHNERGEHSCPICNKDFNRLDQLRRHLYSNHKCKPDEAESIAKANKAKLGKGSR